MSNKKDKKEAIRKQIIDSAKSYSKLLAGHVFLYVFDDQYVEVMFASDRFVHLTGVDTNLSARNFYSKAKSGHLSDSQFFFSERHPFSNAKKKLPCLLVLSKLTNDLVCVVKDLSTLTITYKLGITNLSFTLGLTENLDPSGKKRDQYLLPQTLRVKDSAIENSSNAAFVSYIFDKEASVEKYQRVLFCDKGAHLPEEVFGMLSDDLQKTILSQTPSGDHAALCSSS